MMVWLMLGNALLIFCLRLIDVSLGTMRMIMINRGRRKIAPLLGFMEVTIWVVAISQVITNLDNIFNILGYSGGFAIGTLVGMWIEDKLAIGYVEISIFSTTHGQKIVRKLRQADYGVTELTGNGRTGIVNLITTIVPRRDVKNIFQLVNQTDPKSFIAVDDMKDVKRGYMHVGK
jgi:uncharacterized protein YebE (UPF0316 family)